LPPKKNLLARRSPKGVGGKLSSAFVKTSAGQGGAAPPPFRIFAGLRLAEVALATQAGGLPRRRRRQNAFGLIQEYCIILNTFVFKSG